MGRTWHDFSSVDYTNVMVDVTATEVGQLKSPSSLCQLKMNETYNIGIKRLKIYNIFE